jgi:hypothetical protein
MDIALVRSPARLRFPHYTSHRPAASHAACRRCSALRCCCPPAPRAATAPPAPHAVPRAAASSPSHTSSRLSGGVRTPQPSMTCTAAALPRLLGGARSRVGQGKMKLRRQPGEDEASVESSCLHHHQCAALEARERWTGVDMLSPWFLMAYPCSCS